MEGKTDERKNTEPHELEQLSGVHSDMFRNPPHGLPPTRSWDHTIELMPESAPIRKKSYRQSHRNKSEIKFMV